MTSIYLIRHGDYLEGQIDGRGPLRDLGLSALGTAQVETLRRRLLATGEIKAQSLYASTLPRAMQTAQALAGAFGKPVIADHDLEEWRNEDGTLHRDDFLAQWKGLNDRDRQFHRFGPGCETALEFTTRVQAALHRIIQRHSGETTVCVAHGGVVQVAFQYFFGFGDAAFRRAYPASDHTSITHWRQDSDTLKWVLERSNDVQHRQADA